MTQTYEQHTLEHFFKEYQVTDPDKKAQLLSILTGVVFEYNDHVVQFQKETDDYKKKQLEESIEEYLQKIDRIIKGEEELYLS
jgi:F0F1-type ATP synthase delta subunit